jgi:hypothetical protein
MPPASSIVSVNFEQLLIINNVQGVTALAAGTWFCMICFLVAGGAGRPWLLIVAVD